MKERTSPSDRRLNKNIPAIGITLGDPAGIGPEVVLRALSQGGMRRLRANITVIGERATWDALRRRLKFREPRVTMVDTSCLDRAALAGRPSAATARAAWRALESAARLVSAGKITAVVTGPVSKETLQKAGLRFTGHTEFFQSYWRTPKVAMMFVAGPLRVSLVTRHIPLGRVPQQLTAGLIWDVLELTYRFLKDKERIQRPRIAVAGLNPHAGEGGRVGHEELRLIAPVVRRARRRGWAVRGPLPPDTVFYHAYHGRFDAIVSMYHDHGLTPLKMLYFDRAVNITLGLPFVRTSPDHGTAFEQAPRYSADPGSMIEAIRWAIKLCR